MAPSPLSCTCFWRAQH